jgi:GT2 family glycosyltransferase
LEKWLLWPHRDLTAQNHRSGEAIAQRLPGKSEPMKSGDAMANQAGATPRGNHSSPLVGSVVVAFGSPEDTIECLESLRGQTDARQIITVVQNGAEEAAMDRFERLFPEIHTIRNGENMGAAAGRNLGMRQAMRHDPDFLFYVDNDITLAPNALQELLRAAQDHPDAGFISCIVYLKCDREKILSAGALMKPPLEDAHLLEINPDLKTYEVDFVSSCAMLVPATMAEQIGGMDERLFLWEEDVDWCLRGHQAGWKTIVVASATAYHDARPEEKNLSPKHLYYFLRNRLVVARRYGYLSSLWQKKVFYPLLLRFLNTLFAKTDLSITRAMAFMIALFHFRQGRLGRCPAFLDQNNDAFWERRVRQRLKKTFS